MLGSPYHPALATFILAQFDATDGSWEQVSKAVHLMMAHHPIEVKGIEAVIERLVEKARWELNNIKQDN